MTLVYFLHVTFLLTQRENKLRAFHQRRREKWENEKEAYKVFTNDLEWK